jgi:hypothetical protein
MYIIKFKKDFYKSDKLDSCIVILLSIYINIYANFNFIPRYKLCLKKTAIILLTTDYFFVIFKKVFRINKYSNSIKIIC